MLIAILLVAVGVALVSYGANILVDGASAIAKGLRVSDMVIGLTIVSFGTSAPELIVSLMAAIEGKTDIAVGNIVGSNIANIWIILGISGLIAPLIFQHNTVWKEIPFSLVAILAAWFMINDTVLDGVSPAQITRSEGMVLLLFFGIYLYYMFSVAKQDAANQTETGNMIQHRAVWLSVLMIVGGIVGLTFGGKLIVDNAVLIARTLGVSDALIGLTLVSIGTSIPELATSIVAAMKKNSDIAIGNVVGSNIFNVLLILGISATVAPLPMKGIGNIDFGVCVLATLGLFISTFLLDKMRIYRVEAGIFLLCYGGYLAYLMSNM